MTPATETFVRFLTGHSGCILSLYRDENGLFVRKTSGSHEYNKRLEKQCIKQRLAGGDNFSTPAVLRAGYDKNGLFYFDMQFLNCQSMDKYFKTIKMGTIPAIVANLFRAFPIETAIDTDASDQIGAKISELRSKIKEPSPNVCTALDMLMRYDFSDLPQSACHGDLTLENIMISDDGKIYLIDLLDSFFNSWIIDIAKILQDIDLHWSYRHGKMDANLALRLMVAKEEIFKNILSMNNGTKILADIYHILLLNVIRIYPYAKDDVTFAFLDKALEKVFKQIKDLQ